MKTPFFSIIIPTLNEEKMLPKLLSDIAKQEKRNFEVCVVDGHSEDKTPHIVHSFEDRISLKFISVNKRQVSYQRNQGAAAARGEYLVFFDADIRISRFFSTQLTKALSKNKYLLSFPRFFSIERFFQDRSLFNALNMTIEASQMTTKPLLMGFGMVFERNFFNHLGGFDEALFMAEDHDIVSRARKVGVQAKMLKNIAVRVSIRRFKREGSLALLRKYTIATIQTFKTGGVEKKLFDYTMGGDYYEQKSRKNRTFEEEIRELFGHLKNRLNKVV